MEHFLLLVLTALYPEYNDVFSKRTVVRYLDASKSNSTGDWMGIIKMPMLIFLNMSSSFLTELRLIEVPNLLTLDISHNSLSSLRIDSLLICLSLKELLAKSNPLTNIIRSDNQTLPNIVNIDFSQTGFLQFPIEGLETFTNLRMLKITDGKITSFPSISKLANLNEIDIKGNPIAIVSKNAFLGLNKLRKVQASLYKVCCGEILPPNVLPEHCIAPENEISSCENLLRSDVYRVFLWIFAIVALIGNTGCLVMRLSSQR